MTFNVDEAIKVANQVMLAKIKRNLTDVEIMIIKGAWEREDYDQIAAKNQYATSYISQDIAPKLWKMLTKSLGEKVKKSNFKEALKRVWEKQSTLTTVLQNQESTTTQSLPSGVNKQQLVVSQPAQQVPPDHPLFPSSREGTTREAIFSETLLQHSSLIRINASRQMSKTSVVEELLAQVEQQNYQTVKLSFEFADPQIHFTNFNRFLRWFCLNLTRQLSLPNKLDDYWDEEGVGSKVSCTIYLEEYLLAQSERPLVVCLDDVDLLFPYPEVYEDFFGLLRSWYEKTRNRRLWKKLRLVIVYLTEVSLSPPINQSPFIVGRMV
ncbi:MAG: hypothetical protein F6K47_15195 [Symploca sp. SIO2E6]|nr:hypothetical protein [Symploca sp. SIO2E6]